MIYWFSACVLIGGTRTLSNISMSEVNSSLQCRVIIQSMLQVVSALSRLFLFIFEYFLFQVVPEVLVAGARESEFEESGFLRLSQIGEEVG